MAASGDSRVQVLVVDPELGRRIPPSAVTEARARLVAPAIALECGTWEVARPHTTAHLGFLLLEGLLARELVLAGGVSTELLGEGDLIQPWVAASIDRLVRLRVTWRVLEPVRVAVLDESFAREAGRWPEVHAALLERAVRRTVRQGVHQALLQLSPVETRLLVLFWHLAERWGRVTPAGIVLPLRLPHQLLGQLVGCQRASVTTALKHVAASGLLERRKAGGWLLHGAPPAEFIHLFWDREDHAPFTHTRSSRPTPGRKLASAPTAHL